MSAVAAAIIGSAVIGAGTAYLVSESQKDAAKEASKAQKEIADKNIALQKELTETQREDFAPWREAGEQALTRIQEGIDAGTFDVGKFDPSKVDVTQDPGYAFRLKQGVEALDASAAARGRTTSGAQQKALMRFGQDLGSQEYGNAYARALAEHQLENRRRVQNYNILSGLSSTGQASAARQAGATSQLAGTSGNILQNLGDARARSAYQQGQAEADMYQGVGRSLNQGAQNWLLYSSMNPGTQNPSGTIPPETIAPDYGVA